MGCGTRYLGGRINSTCRLILRKVVKVREVKKDSIYLLQVRGGVGEWSLSEEHREGQIPTGEHKFPCGHFAV